jgi:hypothetical protein
MELFGSSLNEDSRHRESADEKQLRDTVAIAITKADAILNQNPKTASTRKVSRTPYWPAEASAKRRIVNGGGKAKRRDPGRYSNLSIVC